ncbi:MAG: transglutaminase-like domain-containing protein [Ilumatobacteraceae bacterium]
MNDSAPATGVRRLVPTLREGIDVAAVFVITLVALFAYRSSYGGVAFLVNGAIAALVAVVLVYVAHKLAWPSWVVAIFGLLAYIVLASLLALRHYGYGGVVPSPTSAYEALTSAATAWKELLTTSPPVGATGDLMVIPVFVGFVTAFLMAAVALTRWAPAALVPPMVALGLGIAVGTNEPVSVILHGAILAVLVFAWLAYREHVRRPLLHALGLDWRGLATGGVVLGGVAVAALFVGPNLPGAGHTERAIWRQTVTPPFDPHVYPSPLNAYRKYVKLDRDPNTHDQVAAEPMFTIEGLPAGIPVRLVTMDKYDGLVWQVASNNDDPSLRDSGSFERIGTSLKPDTTGQTATVTVTIDKYSDVWVPDVGEVISLRFTGSAGGAERDRQLADSFRYNRETDTAATPVKLREGDRYVMTVRLPNMLDSLTGKQIDASTGARLGPAVSVSDVTAAFETPDILAISDTGARLDRIKQLMLGGAYSDGDRASGQSGSRAGHSAYRLSEFAGNFPAVPMVGDAEQYASTYALLFRDLNKLPTRVVMGFVPDKASIDEPYTVLQTDVNAWVEVPVSGLGWVAIFPTPPRSQLQANPAAPKQPDPEYRTQNPPPPPAVDPEFDRPATEAGATKALQQQPEQQADKTGTDHKSSPNALARFVGRPVVAAALIGASPFLLWGLVLIGVAIVKLLRRRRRRTRGAGHARVANGWREVADLAVDLGHAVPPATTRKEAAVFISGVQPETGSVALADRADAVVWGGAEVSDAEVEEYWNELVRELKSMKRAAPFGARLRSAVSWQSLKRRDRENAGG